MGVQEFKKCHLDAINTWDSWYDNYYNAYSAMREKLDAMRNELKKGKKFDIENKNDFEFLKRFLFDDDSKLYGNGVAIADKGKLQFSADRFKDLLRMNGALDIIEALIKEPSATASTKLRKLIYDYNQSIGLHIRNRYLIANRAIAACTDKVSPAVDVIVFSQVFNFLIERNIVSDYEEKCTFHFVPSVDENGNPIKEFKWIRQMKEVEWYNENVYLMDELKKIFANELTSKKTSVRSLGIFIWYLWASHVEPLNEKRKQQ